MGLGGGEKLKIKDSFDNEARQDIPIYIRRYIEENIREVDDRNIIYEALFNVFLKYK